jgi:hypothetical protein
MTSIFLPLASVTLESTECFFRSFILRIGFIISPQQKNHTRPHKAAHVIRINLKISKLVNNLASNQKISQKYHWAP